MRLFYIYLEACKPVLPVPFYQNLEKLGIHKNLKIYLYWWWSDNIQTHNTAISWLIWHWPFHTLYTHTWSKKLTSNTTKTFPSRFLRENYVDFYFRLGEWRFHRVIECIKFVCIKFVCIKLMKKTTVVTKWYCYGFGKYLTTLSDLIWTDIKWTDIKWTDIKWTDINMNARRHSKIKTIKNLNLFHFFDVFLI